MKIGGRIAEKRKELGLTQAELNVSCDYLLKGAENACTDASAEASKGKATSVTRLLGSLIGKKVEIDCFDEEVDEDVLGMPCRVLGFELNWIQVETLKKSDNVKKLIPVSTIASIKIFNE